MKPLVEIWLVAMVGVLVGSAVKWMFHDPLWRLLEMLYGDDRAARAHYSGLTSATLILVFGLLSLAVYRSFKPRP